MRSFFLFPITLSLALASLAQAESPRSQAINFGRSENSLVEARDVEAALEVLRRANYNLEDHVLKRSGSYSYKSKGDICYCKPEHHHHSSTKKHHSKPTTSVHQPGNHKPTHHSSTYHHPEPTTKWGHHHHSSSTTSSHKSEPTGKPSCPSGYKCASKGDTFVYNDNDLIDLKNLDINIDILNFSSASSSPVKSTKTAKEQPKCEDKYCCYKAWPGKKGSSPNKPSCPSGYKSASRGDTFVSNDNDLVDAKGLSVVIDILSFSSASTTPVSTRKPSSSSPKCEDEYCCYKDGSEKDSGSGKATCPSGYSSYGKGDTIVKNDNDLIDLKDVTITLNILSFAAPTASPVSTTHSPKDAPKCESETCCVKQTSKKGDTIVSNDNDVVDAKGATVKLCILAICV